MFNVNVHEHGNGIKLVFVCFQHTEAVGLQQGKGNLIYYSYYTFLIVKQSLFTVSTCSFINKYIH